MVTFSSQVAQRANYLFNTLFLRCTANLWLHYLAKLIDPFPVFFVVKIVPHHSFDFIIWLPPKAQCNACVTVESIAEYCSHNFDVTQCPEWLAFSKIDLAETARKQIDAWVQVAEGVNEFGDPIGTIYPGGSPLFDETTGESYDLYEYVAMQHADAPWRVEEEPTDMCCFAYSSECLACAEGMDVVTWFTAHKLGRERLGD